MKWTKRFRERWRGAGERLREYVDWKGLGVLAVVLTVIVWAVFVYPMLKEPPLVERDFTARIVDKSFTIRESDRALPPSLKLLVEQRDGRRFNIGVTGDFYERARVGMWLSRRGGELKLHSDEPAPQGDDGTKVEAR